jgi:adenine deaminase
LRQVMAAGIDPVTAIQMATINVAEYFGLTDDLGSIAPGKIANLVAVESLTELRNPTVFSSGRVIVERGQFIGDRSRTGEVPPYLKSVINLGREIGAKDFRIAAPVGNGRARVRVMGIVDGTLLSDALTETLEIRDGEILADTSRDILKIAVLDRHKGTGAIGLGFVKGFGLQAGALATTFFWQHFSLLVVGTSDAEMAAAVAAMVKLGGGVLAVRNGELLHATAFPVGGILGTQSLEGMYRDLSGFEEAVRSLGSPLQNPFTSLAFASIPHIPHYGITDKGWYDTFAETFVDIVLDAQEEARVVDDSYAISVD